MSEKDVSHLQLLAIFHYVLAGFVLLSGCLSLVYLALGIAMMTNPEFMQRVAPPEMHSYQTHEEMQEEVLFGGEVPPGPEQPDIGPAAPEPTYNAEDEGIKVVGGIMAGFGAVVFLLASTFAILMIVAGRSLQKRKRYRLCMIVAGLSCLMIPVGTILGVFTLIVLQRPAIAAAFKGAEA